MHGDPGNARLDDAAVEAAAAGVSGFQPTGGTGRQAHLGIHDRLKVEVASKRYFIVDKPG